MQCRVIEREAEKYGITFHKRKSAMNKNRSDNSVGSVTNCTDRNLADCEQRSGQEKERNLIKWSAVVFTSVYFLCLSHCPSGSNVCAVGKRQCTEYMENCYSSISLVVVVFKWPNGDVWWFRRLFDFRSCRPIINSCHTMSTSVQTLVLIFSTVTVDQRQY